MSRAPVAVESFLAQFHDQAPGGSPRAFADTPVVNARNGTRHGSTYHALADAVSQAVAQAAPPGAFHTPTAAEAATARRAASPPDHGPVLDLACGDGHLLALLRAGLAPGPRLLGVDFSRGELAAAHRRLGDQAGLMQARAQALPLRARSMAVVTSHMALMLMAAPDAVAAEVARVLRAGGRLVALVPHAAPAPDASPFFDAWRQAIHLEPRAAAWEAVRFEGRAWCQADSLRALLAPHFAEPAITPLQATRTFTLEPAWQWMTGMYDLALLPADAWPRVRARFEAALAPRLSPDGTIAVTHRYLLIDAVVAR